MREHWRICAKFAALLAIFWLAQFAIDQFIGRPPLEDQLIEAICCGDPEELEHALRDGASVTWNDEQGLTALGFAAHQGELRMARRLLDAGADVNHADNDGATPLIWAVQGKHIEMVRLLIERGANPSLRDNQGVTARDLAETCKFTDIVDLLREAEQERVCVNSNG
jgi:ankyrin repeat protein